MRYSVSWLKEYLDTKSSAQELSERCTATGLEVEAVFTGDNLSALLSSEGVSADVMAALANDSIIEVNVTANRPDWAGIYGIARDLAASGMGTLKPLPIPQIAEMSGFKSPISVSNELSKEFAHHASQFVGRYIRNVKNIGESSVAVRANLAAVGARCVNPLVDVTNYFCFGFCRPLHVFDADKIVGGIVVRHSRAGEKFIGLDGKAYELPAALNVIADDAGVLAIAGVLGGERSGCTSVTKNVFLEVAYFDPVQTAKAGRVLGITSAARYRFERGVDPMFLESAEKLATKMILDTCGGEASSVCGYGEGFERPIFKYFPKDVKKILGVTVTPEMEKEILSALGIEFGAVNIDTNSIIVKPPSWRVDLTESRDVVEEVARIIGFEAISMEQLFAPKALSSRAPLSALQARQFAAQNCAAKLGFHGAVTWSFMQDSHAASFAALHDGLRIVNPIATDLNYLRPTALGNLLLAAKRNHARSVLSVSLCEVGPAFTFENGEACQHLRVVGIRSGVAASRSWFEKQRKVDAFDVKGDLYAMLIELGVDPERCVLDAKSAPSYYHAGLSAALSIGGKAIGYFGIVHPNVREVLGVDEVCAAFEILLEALPPIELNRGELVRNDSQIVERDFAFLVPKEIEAREVEACARNSVKNSSVPLDNFSVTIFDRFMGKGIEPGKKSIAFSITMQPLSGTTLESAEIEKIASAVFAGVTNELGGVQR